MGRNSHDGPGTILHQDIIGNPYRYFFAGIRIDGFFSRIDTFFLHFTRVFSEALLRNISFYPLLSLFPLSRVRYQLLA